MNYNTNNTKRARFRLIAFAAACVILFTAVFLFWQDRLAASAEDSLVTCYILCKPGSRVNVRRTPSKRGEEVGFLEVGDSFETDGVSSNGWIRCYGIGEYGEGWIWCGYVAEEEPVPVFGQYVCAAPNRVACRKWMNGPQTSLPWLKNGSDVQVFYIAGEWAITARGYIKSEYLEPDPK